MTAWPVPVPPTKPPVARPSRRWRARSGWSSGQPPCRHGPSPPSHSDDAVPFEGWSTWVRERRSTDKAHPLVTVLRQVSHGMANGLILPGSVSLLSGPGMDNLRVRFKDRKVAGPVALPPR